MGVFREFPVQPPQINSFLNMRKNRSDIIGTPRNLKPQNFHHATPMIVVDLHEFPPQAIPSTSSEKGSMARRGWS